MKMNTSDVKEGERYIEFQKWLTENNPRVYRKLTKALKEFDKTVPKDKNVNEKSEEVRDEDIEKARLGRGYTNFRLWMIGLQGNGEQAWETYRRRRWYEYIDGAQSEYHRQKEYRESNQ
jgi:hypothetical protein